MKRFIVVAALLFMMIGLAGCADSDNGNNANDAAINANEETGGDHETNDASANDLNLPSLVKRTPDSDLSASLEITGTTEVNGFIFELTANAFDTQSIVEGTAHRNHENV